MVYCKYCVHYDVEHHQACCSTLCKIVNEEQCITCSSYLWRYKDLDIGQCYFDTATMHFGIKLTSCRAYNLDEKHVYGFAGNHENDSEDRRYLKANIEWW